MPFLYNKIDDYLNGFLKDKKKLSWEQYVERWGTGCTYDLNI